MTLLLFEYVHISHFCILPFVFSLLSFTYVSNDEGWASWQSVCCLELLARPEKRQNCIVLIWTPIFECCRSKSQTARCSCFKRNFKCLLACNCDAVECCNLAENKLNKPVYFLWLLICQRNIFHNSFAIQNNAKITVVTQSDTWCTLQIIHFFKLFEAFLRRCIKHVRKIS